MNAFETKQQETTEQGESEDRKLLIKVTSAPSVAGTCDSRGGGASKRSPVSHGAGRQPLVVRHLTHGQTFGDGCEELCKVWRPHVGHTPSVSHGDSLKRFWHVLLLENP